MNTKATHESSHRSGCSSEHSWSSASLPEALPVDPEPPLLVEGNERSAFGLVELVLKSPTRLNALMNHDEREPIQLIPKLLGIALVSYFLYASAMVVILNTAPPDAYPARELLPAPPASWSNGSALALVVAYIVGLVATTCICLPSFYFFSLLAGVKLSMLQVVGQVVRSKASAAIVLIGILPIYVAVILGLIVFQAGAPYLEVCLYLGLILPFIAGLEGVRSIYRGVKSMAYTLPVERRERRECFLRRLTLSWAAVYTAVSPVMIYVLWDYLAKQFT